ncbi:small nuclear ribonucleoprotein E [Vigna unguiculata]|uniref:Sm protein E n=1 Tax=Vigna unguiculata TaxID=3917 RepID=A0A4D6KXY0_VIGUN|nr:small nuclear ribonucleoprotein E [Vigna unguiculata]
MGVTFYKQSSDHGAEHSSDHGAQHTSDHGAEQSSDHGAQHASDHGTQNTSTNLTLCSEKLLLIKNIVAPIIGIAKSKKDKSKKRQRGKDIWKLGKAMKKTERKKNGRKKMGLQKMGVTFYKQLSDHGAEHLSDHGAQHTSDHGAEPSSDHGAEHTSDHGVEHSSDHGAEHTSDHGAEHSSDHGTQHTSDHGAQNTSTNLTLCSEKLLLIKNIVAPGVGKARKRKKKISSLVAKLHTVIEEKDNWFRAFPQLSLTNTVSFLRRLAQRSCFNLPSYTCIREGPDHTPRFKATVNFNGEIFESPHLLKARIQIWLFEQKDLRIEGRIIGFDEYMNLVLDDAEEVNIKKKSKKTLVCVTIMLVYPSALQGCMPLWVVAVVLCNVAKIVALRGVFKVSDEVILHHDHHGFHRKEIEALDMLSICFYRQKLCPKGIKMEEFDGMTFTLNIFIEINYKSHYENTRTAKRNAFSSEKETIVISSQLQIGVNPFLVEPPNSARSDTTRLSPTITTRVVISSQLQIGVNPFLVEPPNSARSDTTRLSPTITTRDLTLKEDQLINMIEDDFVVICRYK